MRVEAAALPHAGVVDRDVAPQAPRPTSAMWTSASPTLTIGARISPITTPGWVQVARTGRIARTGAAEETGAVETTGEMAMPGGIARTHAAEETGAAAGMAAEETGAATGTSQQSEAGR